MTRMIRNSCLVSLPLVLRSPKPETGTTNRAQGVCWCLTPKLQPWKSLFICSLMLVILELSLALCLSASCALSSLVPAHAWKGLILHSKGPLKSISQLFSQLAALRKDLVAVSTTTDSISNTVLAAAFCFSAFKQTRIGWSPFMQHLKLQTRMRDTNPTSAWSNSVLDIALSLKIS